MIYWAEIRNIEDDPSKSGRVKLRFYPQYGLDYSDEQNIKDDDLPWAMPLMPITSASTNKAGVIPTGLQVGSRVAVMFAAEDTEKQYPIVLGSFFRAYPPIVNEQQSDSNKDGFDSVDQDQKGVDLPSNARSIEDNIGRNPLNPRITPNDIETESV